MAIDGGVNTFISRYAALLSTFVFFWDVYKWRTAGPRLDFNVSPNMIIVPGPKTTYISANVSNRGDRATTITNLGFLCFDHRRIPFFVDWRRFRIRRCLPIRAMVVASPSTGQPLPFELKPGGVWSGMSIQDSELETLARKSKLYMALYHSHRSRPTLVRVTIPQPVKAG